MARNAPPKKSARGMVRRGLSISSPMNEPVSQPPKAKKMVDQKMAFLRDRCGVKAEAVKWVAGPKRAAETAASTTRMRMGSQLPVEQTLLSHLPASRPTMLTKVMMASQITAKDMK